MSFTRFCSFGDTDAWLRCDADKRGRSFDEVKAIWDKTGEQTYEKRHGRMLAFVIEMKKYPQVKQLCKSCPP